MKTVFITGGTGYIGTRLIRQLLQRGHRVIAFVRPGSEHKVSEKPSENPWRAIRCIFCRHTAAVFSAIGQDYSLKNEPCMTPKPALSHLARGFQTVSDGAEVVSGNPFDPGSLIPAIPPDGIFVQLLGVPHPSPRKREQFYQIDLPSVQASAEAAKKAGASHFVYVSVAQEPTNIMKDYQAVRAEGERCILDAGMPHTFIRPWYVVGPGHWWPLLLWPVYKILEWMPATRRKAQALGLVSIRQMLNTLVMVIEQPEYAGEVVDVTAIRKAEVRACRTSALLF